MALMGLSLQASTLLVGDPPVLGTGNCDPFGCPAFFGLGTFQEVYSSSAFTTGGITGEVAISALTFIDFQVHNGGVPAGGTFTLTLSYTSDAPGSLNLTNPNNNITPGTSQTFFSGLLPNPLPQTGGQVLNIPGTPFDYNPADGNLLLTVTMTGASNGAPPIFLDQSECGPTTTTCPTGSTVTTGTAYFPTTGSGGGNDIGGLITQFTYTNPLATPEPGSLLLVVAGIGLIGYSRLRRRTT
jgi:hypothetical protein